LPGESQAISARTNAAQVQPSRYNESGIGARGTWGTVVMETGRRRLWNRLFGQAGEREAARYLKRSGLRILCRGYRTDHGEIDLVALDGDVVVFVEVKARRQGEPAEAVTAEKQRRLSLAALHFLKKHGLLDQPCRFDVVAIVWPEDRSAPQIEHIRHAFEAVGRWQMFR
jgi:putative endonuclease